MTRFHSLAPGQKILQEKGQYGRYRAVSWAAVGSLVCGALSFLPIFWWILGLVPAAGLVLGYWAVRQIRQSPLEVTGQRVAQTGLALSCVLGLLSFGWLAFQEIREVPIGYQLVNYDDLQPEPTAPVNTIPQKALKLNEKRIYIKGYMYPGRQQARLKEFAISPSNGVCPFCIPNPRPTEMIRITLQGDLEIDYTTHIIGLGGVFRVEPDDRRGVPYALEADYLR